MQTKKHPKERKSGRPKLAEVAKSLLGKKLRCVQGDKKNSEMQNILDIGGTAYRNYLSGERYPDARSLARLAAATGVDLNWLLDDNEDIPADGKPITTGNDNDENKCVDGLMVAQLQTTIDKLKARNEALEDALVSMKRERDEALEAARTAGYLRNSEASGA